MTSASSIAIRPWRPALVGILLLFTLVLLLATAPLRVAGQQLTLDGEEQAFVELINAYRAENGAPPLNVSATLNSAARWMSEDMAANDYFSHTDSLGRDPFQRMADFGYNYNTWKGENLAAGSDTAAYTFELWRDSSGHNSNMLNPNFVVIGVARVYNPPPNSSYGWYWTTDFGGFDDSGGPPPTNTPTPTPSETPPPPTPTETPPPPTPTETPPPPTPTETPPPPTPTETPPPPTPTETPPPLTPTETPPPPTPTETPPPPTPTETPPPATPAPGVDLVVPARANPGIAPPIRHNSDRPEGEPLLVVRELVPGWNRVQGLARAMPIAEALPVEGSKITAIYAWDAEEGKWRRYLPGIGIPDLNTLQEIPVDQAVWVLARKRFQMTLLA